MEVYRLVRTKFAGSLSGKGAAMKGGRWNAPGIELIYTAGNRSLAMAEVAIYFTLATIPADYIMLIIYVPDNLSLKRINEADLPADWNVFPHPASTQSIGNKFVAGNTHCILQLPSVVTRGDHNFLINPNHPEFKRIKIIESENFPFDKRIFK